MCLKKIGCIRVPCCLQQVLHMLVSVYLILKLFTMSSNVKSRDLCFLLCCLSWASLTTDGLMLGSHWCHPHMIQLLNNTSKCRWLCWVILSLKKDRNLQIKGRYMYPRLDLVVLKPNKELVHTLSRCCKLASKHKLSK